MIEKLITLNDALAIRFSHVWYQEDISELYSALIQKLSNAILLEHIIGADRESYRFEWQQLEYIIYFDFYSQSIWCEQQPTGQEINNNWQEIFSTYWQEI